MAIAIRLESRADVQPVRRGTIDGKLASQVTKRRDVEIRPGLATAELAFRIFAAFRAHPHINNVLTHISRARWVEVEQSLNLILDLAATSDGLSPLGQNIIDLMVAERGITGKILKPYFHAALRRLLEAHEAERLISHIETLFLELEWKAQHPVTTCPQLNEPSQEASHV